MPILSTWASRQDWVIVGNYVYSITAAALRFPSCSGWGFLEAFRSKYAEGHGTLDQQGWARQNDSLPSLQRVYVQRGRCGLSAGHFPSQFPLQLACWDEAVPLLPSQHWAVTMYWSLQSLYHIPVNNYKTKKAKKAVNLYNAKVLFFINVTKSTTVKKFQKLLYAMLNKNKNFGRTLANKNVNVMKSL